MSSKKLFNDGSQPKGPVAFKSINVRRLTIRLWAWKVFCFVKRKRNDLHKKQVKIGTMAMFTKFSDSVAGDLLHQSNYATAMFDAVFGSEEIASLDWDGVVMRLRAFEDEEGLPNTIPFMTNFAPTPLTVQVHSGGTPKPVDVELTSMSDPKATAAETIVHYDLPHEELDHIISTLQHELLPLVRADVSDRRAVLVNFQRWLITMQNLASKYDDTQMKLLKRAQQVKPEDSAPKKTTNILKPSSNKLASSFYKQLVETRRQLEEVESQVDRLKDALGPADDENINAPQGGKQSRLQIVTEEVSAPVGGGRGRRASVSVRSMLDAAASKPASKPKTVFSIIEEEEEEEENEIVNSSKIETTTPIKQKVESSKTRLYQKAENDKADLISANIMLRDKLMSSSNFEDNESRKIVSELKMWEQERDTLEAQIEQHEDYINSLRARISNFQSGKIRGSTFL